MRGLHELRVLAQGTLDHSEHFRLPLCPILREDLIPSRTLSVANSLEKLS